MLRAFVFVCLFIGCTPLLAANFWISASADVCFGQSGAACPQLTPPSSQVETINHTPSNTQGTFYIWGRPDAGKNLGVWGLNVVSTNPSVVSISQASTAVEVYNPSLGNIGGVPAYRWESIFQPFGTTTVNDVQVPTVQSTGIRATTLRYHGFQLNPTGLGVGPTNTSDPLYNSAKNAWLLASVDYNIHGPSGQTSVYLQIAENGMSQNGEDSAATSAVFGKTSDLALSANMQRKTNSQTADLLINVSNGISGDFNANGKVDGRDFLMWQRNPAIGNLADWQSNYGQGALVSSLEVPEPAIAVQLGLLGLVSVSGLRYRWPSSILADPRARR